MRILFDGRKLGDTGIGRYSAQLLQALLQEFDDLEVVLLVHSDRLATGSEAAELTVHSRVVTVNVSAPVFSLAEQWMFRQMDQRYMPALIHVPHFNIPLLVRTPVVSTIHDVIPLDFPEELPGLRARWYYQQMNRLALQRSTAVIVPSQTTATKIAEHFGSRSRSLHVIAEAPAPDFSQRAYPVLWATLQQRCQLPERYLLVIGLHKPHKQTQLAIALLHQLREKYGHHQLRLMVVGPSDPRYTPALKADAEQRGVAGLVHWLSDLKAADIPSLYQHAEALVFPSALEGFGLPILEGMACGTPVLGFETPSNQEVGGDAMVLAAANDVRMLARMAHDILSNPSQRSAVVAKGLAHASRFSWLQAARQTRDVYDQVMLD